MDPDPRPGAPARSWALGATLLTLGAPGGLTSVHATC